jgi:hypothetical protein
MVYQVISGAARGSRLAANGQLLGLGLTCASSEQMTKGSTGRRRRAFNREQAEAREARLRLQLAACTELARAGALPNHKLPHYLRR